MVAPCAIAYCAVVPGAGTSYRECMVVGVNKCAVCKNIDVLRGIVVDRVRHENVVEGNVNMSEGNNRLVCREPSNVATVVFVLISISVCGVGFVDDVNGSLIKVSIVGRASPTFSVTRVLVAPSRVLLSSLKPSVLLPQNV